MTSTSPRVGTREHRRASPSTLVAVLVLLSVLSTAVASLGAPLLVSIVRTEHVSVGASQWALTITLLFGAVATPVMGRLGDGRHRRATTLAGAGAVTAGCVLSALPAGFATLLVGRALQGVGLGLVPLATAMARDNLPAERSRPTIVVLGITTAAGIGVGYPLAGLFAQYLGLYSAFWFGAAVGAVALVASMVVLPPSPDRRARVDVPGAALLGLGVAGLLLVVAEGPTWGWTTPLTLVLAVVSVLVLAGWALVELRSAHPLIDLRLLRHRSVLAANATGLLVSLGFYPLMSLVVRYVQTPQAVGYGLGAPVVIAGLMLTPFSAASFAASRVAKRAVKVISSEWVVTGSGVALIGGFVIFLLARGAYVEIVIAMAVEGFGVGCVFAVNPLQIVAGVPEAETGSAMSFYQLVRTVAYSLASALSATVLVASIHAGHNQPTDAGYSSAALISILVLVIGLVVSLAFALTSRARCDEQPTSGSGSTGQPRPDGRPSRPRHAASPTRRPNQANVQTRAHRHGRDAACPDS